MGNLGQILHRYPDVIDELAANDAFCEAFLLARARHTPKRSKLSADGADLKIVNVTYGTKVRRDIARFRKFDEPADHEEMDIGTISNFYGGLQLKREGGKDYWGIENYDGTRWEECPSAVASALRNCAPVDTQPPTKE